MHAIWKVSDNHLSDKKFSKSLLEIGKRLLGIRTGFPHETGVLLRSYIEGECDYAKIFNSSRIAQGCICGLKEFCKFLTVH